jgi:hypothetical protein
MTYDLNADVNGPTTEMQQVHHLAITTQDIAFCKFALLINKCGKENKREITFNGL